MNNQHASSKLLFGTFYLRILNLFGFECEEELCLLTKTAEISSFLHLTRQVEELPRYTTPMVFMIMTEMDDNKAKSVGSSTACLS